MEYTSLCNELSETLIIKLPVGSAGNHTFIVNNQNDLDEVQRKFYSYPAIIQSFEKAIPINIQGVVRTTGVIIYPPSIQIIGTEICSYGRFDWCGNDFHILNFLSLELIEKICLRAQGIGEYLLNKGYLGIFGLDMLVNHESGGVYFLELNPRFQGSTSLLSQLEIINGAGTNIIYNHITAFTGIQEPEMEISVPQKCWPHGGSQVVLHNKHRKPCIVKKSLQSGIYKIDKHRRLQFIRPGYNLLDCIGSDEFVISYGTPIEGELVVPGAPLLWVQIRRSVLINPAIGKLTSEMETICSAIYSEVECIEF